MGDMMQGEGMGGGAGEISVAVGKSAQPGTQVSGTWTGTVKSNDGGNATVTLDSVQADVNQADESMSGLMGESGQEMGGVA
jgi:hypothetical protein